MVQNMKDNGKMICRMATELKPGLMVLDMKVIIWKERNMEKVLFIIIIAYTLGNYLWADGSRYIGNWHENKISGYVKL